MMCSTTGIPQISDVPHSRKGSPGAVDIPPETLEKIVAFYAEDFATFGYDAPVSAHS